MQQVTKHFVKKEKTGISQAAFAAFITSFALGILPFFDLDVTAQQATNLGLCIASAAWFAKRQLDKRLEQ